MSRFYVLLSSSCSFHKSHMETVESLVHAYPNCISSAEIITYYSS